MDKETQREKELRGVIRDAIMYFNKMIPNATQSFFQIGITNSYCADNPFVNIELSSCARVSTLDFVFHRVIEIKFCNATYKNLLKRSLKVFKATSKNDSACNLYGNDPRVFFDENGKNLKLLTLNEYEKLFREYGWSYNNALWKIKNALENEIKRVKDDEKKEVVNG